MTHTKTTDASDEDIKRLLEMLMNRYDLRPSDAGSLLAEIDKLVESKTAPKCGVCHTTVEVSASALTNGQPMCRPCFITWYGSGIIHGTEILAERERRKAAGLYPFGEPPEYKP